jgi:hypothetical protein
MMSVVGPTLPSSAPSHHVCCLQHELPSPDLNFDNARDRSGVIETRRFE